MENLNNVPSTGTFGGSVSKINSNFDLVVNAINSLEYQTTRSKGILNYGQNPATVFPNAVTGDWCMILSEGNVFPATIKTYNGSTWSGSGTWNPDGVDLTGYAKTTDMTTAIAYSLSQATARMGYGECTVSGTSLAVSIPNFILPTSGGTIHIKMSAAGIGASTLNINNTGAKTLLYNGEEVSSANTWGAGEIISVFYDGTRFMASNSQGGGGKAEKIRYDNSQSGLSAGNVQEALDVLSEDVDEAASVKHDPSTAADLDIVDGNRFVLVRFKNGHIKTKNFDSSKISTEVLNGTNSDLDIADDNGFVLARFNKGNFCVKGFNSKYIIENWFKGKTVAIIGDSISTNGNTGTNHNVSEITIASEDIGKSLSAYLTYYDVNAGLSLGGHTFTSSEIGTEVAFTPTVDDIGKSIGLPNNYNANSVKTWWEVAASKLDFNPIPVCWSGASITSHDLNTSYNTGSNAHKMDCSHAWHPSQIRKCGVRTVGTMSRVAPDAIIIYRGTNDFSHTSNVALTDDFFSSGALTYPQTDALDNNLFGYKEGLVITINALREAYPFARIYLCTMNIFKRVNYSNPPVNNGRNTLPQWNNAIREVANYMGCGIIEFDKDGITYDNIYPTYANDSATTPTHPNNNGHLLMGERAIKDLLNN